MVLVGLLLVFFGFSFVYLCFFVFKKQAVTLLSEGSVLGDNGLGFGAAKMLTNSKNASDAKPKVLFPSDQCCWAGSTCSGFSALANW